MFPKVLNPNPGIPVTRNTDLVCDPPRGRLELLNFHRFRAERQFVFSVLLKHLAMLIKKEHLRRP